MKRIITVVLLILVSCGNSSGEAEKLFKSGYNLYLKKDLKGAEEYLKKCVEKNSSHKKAYLLLSKIYYFKKMNKEFQTSIEEYLDLTGENSAALKLKARWYIRNKKFKEAKILIERALEINNEDTGGLYLLGMIHYLTKNYSDAIIVFNRAFSDYVYLKEIHKKLNDIYKKLGLTERANNNKEMAEIIAGWEDKEK